MPRTMFHTGIEYEREPWQEEIGKGFQRRKEPDMTDRGLKEKLSQPKQGIGTTGMGEEGEESRPDMPQRSREEKLELMGTSQPQPEQAGGLEEPKERKPGILTRIGEARIGEMEERVRGMRLRNDVEEYGRDMKQALTWLAQAVAAQKTGDPKQALRYITQAFDKVPDGGLTLKIGPPETLTSRNVASAGEAEEVITVKDPQGNIRYLPVNQTTADGLIEQAKSVFSPREYIRTRAKMKAEMEAFNADQIAHPLRFADGHVTISQVDLKTGVKRTEWFKDEQDFIHKYNKPKQWVVPEYEKTQADLEKKETETWRKGLISTPGGLYGRGLEGGRKEGIIAGTEPEEKPVAFGGKGLPLGKKEAQKRVEAGEEVYATGLPRPGTPKAAFDESGRQLTPEELKTYKGKRYATPPKRTTEKTTFLDPNKMFKGRDKAGKEVSGFVVDGKFIPTPGLAKIQSEKGKHTDQSISDMYAEFSKAYDANFIQKRAGEYAAKRGPEDRKKVVEQAIREVLPREYWREPRKWAGEAKFSEKDGKWWREDFLGHKWDVSAHYKGATTPPTKKVEKPKPKITPPGPKDTAGATYTLPITPETKGIQEPGLKKKQKKGLEWHLIPRDQRLGDIDETINDLEPRKSDPFPQPIVKAIKQYAKQGLSQEQIDERLIKEIKAGRLPTWKMHISD